MSHTSVLVAPVLRYLITANTRIVLDATAGAGGHTSAILSGHSSVRVVGLDRDTAALAAAARVLAKFGDRVRLEHAAFSDLAEVAGPGGTDAVLFDLGVSSMQLDTPERGFSYRHDAPLDMRMDETTGVDARAWIEGASDSDLSRTLKEFGDVRRPSSIAKSIRRAAEDGRMATTGDLKRAVSAAVGGRVPVALLSRVFQSIRIAVNDEFGQLEAALESAVDVLRPGGRLVVISYHSHEDRMVKRFMANAEATCICPPELPVCVCNRRPTLRRLTHRAVKPTAAEVLANPRSRSARLRAAEAVTSARDGSRAIGKGARR